MPKLLLGLMFVPFCLIVDNTFLAQQVQIPTLQVCNKTVVVGDAVVHVDARSDAAHAGTFELKIEASCDPNSSAYPGGSLLVRAINMTDSQVTGDIVASGSSIEQMTSAGAVTPTSYLNGKCTNHPASGSSPISGCRFWLSIADNQEVPGRHKTPDIVSLLVFDATGRTVFYATGPVSAVGHIRVSH